jgi:hypothetical protein
MASESQMAYDAGFQSVAAYQRHLAAIGKKAEIDAKRAPIAEFEPRRSDRFMGAGEAGIPISKNRLAEQIRSETEQKARELYENIQIYKKAGLAINNLKAEFLTLLGYRLGTIQEAEVFYNSLECAQRFGAQQ